MFFLINQIIFRFPILLFLVIIFSILEAQAEHLAPSEKEQAWDLVRIRCVLCHYVGRPDYKFAPSLYGLYQRPGQSLTSGIPVTDEAVRVWISNGSANMPAFKYTLNSEEIELIVEFLKQGWVADIPMVRGSR